MVFVQNIWAGTLPRFAALNKNPATATFASAAPLLSSSRNRRRNVFAAQPMILAMSS